MRVEERHLPTEHRAPSNWPAKWSMCSRPARKPNRGWPRVPEVCRIFCATANPTQVIVAQTELGRGVLGVVDGASPLGVETDADIAWRKDLLRKIGYKL